MRGEFMDKNYDLFNDIVVDFEEYEQVTLNDLEKAKIKTRVKSKINSNKHRLDMKNIIAAVMLIAILVTAGLSNEYVRAQIDSIGISIGSFFNREDNNLGNYTAKVLKSAVDKGISLNLNEVIIDDGQLIASLRIDSKNINKSELGIKEKKDLNIIPIADIEIFVEGKKLLDLGGGRKFQYNNDGTVDILMTESFSQIDLDKTYDIKFVCKQLESENNRIINGNWNIDFHASGKAMADVIKTIGINKEISIKHNEDNVNIFLKEIRYSPYSVKLIYEEDGPAERMYMYGLTLFDEDGKEIEEEYGRSTQTGDMMNEYIIPSAAKRFKIVPHIYENSKMIFLEDKGVDVDLASEQ